MLTEDRLLKAIRMQIQNSFSWIQRWTTGGAGAYCTLLVMDLLIKARFIGMKWKKQVSTKAPSDLQKRISCSKIVSVNSKVVPFTTPPPPPTTGIPPSIWCKLRLVLPLLITSRFGRLVLSFTRRLYGRQLYWRWSTTSPGCSEARRHRLSSG